MTGDVEVSQDALGYLLIFKRDIGKHREGDPVTLTSGDIRYFKSQRAATLAARNINAGRKPLTAGGYIGF
jgi:hypothetical protein